MYNLKKTLLTVFILSLPFWLHAQTEKDSSRVLKEVILKGKPYQEVIPVQSLSGVLLEKMASHNVADALRYFAGTQIKDYGGVGGLKTVDVRNMGTHHVGVFYDGIQLGNAQNGVTDLGKYSLDDMESLTMYNGQKSEIFQSAKDFASASAIYLKTKRPVFAGDKKTNLLVRYKTMSINYHDPSFRWEQKLSDKVSMSVSSEYIKSNGQYKFRYKRKNLDGTTAYDTTATRWNSDIEAFRFESGLYGKINKGSWDAKVYYYDSERGAPGAIVENKFRDGFRQFDKNFFGQAFLIKDVSEKYKFQLKGKFAYDYTHYIARDTTNVLGETVTEGVQSDDSYYQQETYFSAVNMYSILPTWDVSLSTDFQYNKLNATRRGIQTQFSFPERYTALVSLATSYRYEGFKVLGNVLATRVIEEVKYNAKAPNKTEFTPALFLGYTPFKKYDFNLRAFAKRIFRMPTFNDLYYTMVGSSTLRPEYMNQYDVGFTYNFPVKESFMDKFSIQADGYYTYTKDKIVAAPTGNLFRWMMTNIGQVKGKGIETVVNLGTHIHKVNLDANLTYTYSKSQDFTKVSGLQMSSYGDQIPYTPWHSGSGILNAGYETWNFNYSFIYVGKRYNGNVNNIKVNEVQPWYTHDLAVQKSFLFNKYKLNATVEVNNAFNQQYEVIYNYPMPGRTFKFIIGFEL
ncbi:TonB-dependent receptor [Flavobacterium quisquiliarum]|uniref:TonB-dependent receptor n=1 Tax=Flavobacterium quisquiliarum TaxID=1834436 RepID=A0ABV8VYV5_9FLAO|nr:TonB-dependent receptor plug domain-containing protein [Flavobacterium quisquiliarum]MBW1653873.1 TonB-dependent receptor plug domain-containing protein [Flavobacterium quisquiliarum]NWL01538.1 TonB-dependent receptor [Flavobacterium collinsii]